MAGIYGAWADRRENIVVLGTLTTATSTAAVEVSANNFTFVHKVIGGNIIIQDEASLDGTDWFLLDTAKAHNQSGIDVHFYPNRIVRFVRSTVTAIGAGESVTVTMACD